MAELEHKVFPGRDDSAEEVEEPVINYRGIKAMPYILGNETFEKLGAIGTLSNLQVYLTTVFNMKRVSATTLLSVFHGTTNFATLIGAFFCDTYFGRYKTLGFGSITSTLGLLAITLTAALKKLHPPQCLPDSAACIGPTPWQMAFLLLGFALMIVGAGTIRPCNLAFGVDQFNPHTESGKRGINSFFNWYFFTLTFAQLVSLTLVVYIQSDVSWPVGLGIPTIFMLISCFVFFIGTKIYVMVKPEGSPLTSLTQVVVAAIRKRRLKLNQQHGLHLFDYTPPKSINSRLPHTPQFRFLDKAAILTEDDEINPDGSSANRWRLCSVQQVEELKCILRVLPVWIAAILYHVGERPQYLVFQAMQSNRHLGSTSFHVPPATYAIFQMIALIICLPIYDRFVVPFLRRLTGKETGITVLQRIGVGIFLTIVASLVGAVVEDKRRSLALLRPLEGVHSHQGAISSMSAFWLVPQLSIVGLAEAFASVGLSEFFYKQFPENMKSFAGSLFFCAMAVSSYINGFLISGVHQWTNKSWSGNWLPEDLNKGRLDYFYYLVACLCAFNFCYFLVCAKWYRYKGTGETPTANVVELQHKKDMDKMIV